MIQQADDTSLFQNSPSKYSNSRKTRKSFTESEASYLNAARELDICIRVNERLRGSPYSWFVTLAFEEVLSIETIKQLWTNIRRKLKIKGIEALRVMEPTTKNTVHYHLIVANSFEEQELKDILEWAMPDRSSVRWHKHIEKINNLGRLSTYIVKGQQEHFQNGKRKPDAYRCKRILFKPKLGLRKIGVVGKFWAKPQKAIWSEIKQDKVRRVGILSNNRKLSHLVNQVASMMPDISRTEIERRLLVNPDCPSLIQWADAAYSSYLASLDDR